MLCYNSNSTELKNSLPKCELCKLQFLRSNKFLIEATETYKVHIITAKRQRKIWTTESMQRIMFLSERSLHCCNLLHRQTLRHIRTQVGGSSQKFNKLLARFDRNLKAVEAIETVEATNTTEATKN